MSHVPEDIAVLSPEKKRELLGRLLRQKAAGPKSAPLTFAQQRLWFLDQLESATSAYHIPLALLISGPLNLAATERSLKEILRRHDILRTTVVAQDGEPVQVIAELQALSLPVTDLRHLSEPERETTLERLAREEFQRPFDLTRDPLLRARLVRCAEEEHVALLTMHHIVSDAWSVGILIGEIGALYGAFSAGQPSPLPELPIHYADYAHWQRRWLQGERLERMLDYWKQQLGGELPVLELPADRARPPIRRFQGDRSPIACSPSLTEQLKRLSQKEGVTLFMTLVAAFKTLLYRYTGQTDILIGTPVANRDQSEIQQLIGLFVNTLVLRTDLAGNPRFRELLARIREVALEAYAHQETPFEKIVEVLQPDRDLSRTPLFQIMFALQNVPLPPLEHPGLKLRQLHLNPGTAKFDLTLELYQSVDGLYGWFEYNTDLFDAATIARMAGHFDTLLKGIVADPAQRLSDLPLLTDGERKQLLIDRNDTAVDYPSQPCVHQLIEAQANRTPEAVAIIVEDQSITYRELDARANQLANHLRRLGVGPETLIGVCLDRSFEMVIGLLGILKAGGAYVPLDPAYPTERLQFMLEDGRLSLVVTQEHLLDRFRISDSPRSPALPLSRSPALICLDRDWPTIAEESFDQPSPNLAADNLAYVIYTSGSTGTPKGVPITHGALINFLLSMRERPGLTDRDILLAVTTISFDIAALEIFLPLSVGARVVLVERDVASDGERLLAKLKMTQATAMQATPATWQLLIEAGWSGNPQLKILCGGESLPRDLANRLLDRGASLWNLYGPTETTIWSSINTIESKLGHVPIGHPIANTQIYILDQFLQPVPIGVPGEIFIGGAGLTRGYLNQPDLTAERLIPHPFSQRPGARLYKTGDVARSRDDGTIEFLGRRDDQVKIRGFRIELGEIEAALREHPGVHEAVVTASEKALGDEQLTAYLIPHPQRAFPIRQWLRFERDGSLANHPYHELPNGMIVFHSHKSEAEYTYQEIFQDQIYLNYGITLNQGDVVFDVGAHVGLFSLFASQVCADILIYAFEPIPPTFELLQMNTSLYGLPAKLFPYGLSARPAERAVFTYFPQVTSMSGLFRDETELEDHETEVREMLSAYLLGQFQKGSGPATMTSQEIERLVAEQFTREQFTCPLKTISAVMGETGVEQINLLKIDAEKSEMDILAGIGEADWPKIQQIVMEVHDVRGQSAKITRWLGQHGYQVTSEPRQQLNGLWNHIVYAIRPSDARPSPFSMHLPRSRPTPATWNSPRQLIAHVRDSLKQKLPDYMVPSAFTWLETLPLTPNGKIDRRALPAPNQSSVKLTKTYTAPRTPVEQMLAEIWAEVLALERVGIDDNFFELGGHSLLALRLISRVREACQMDLPLHVLFGSEPTIAEIARAIEVYQIEQATAEDVAETLRELNELSDDEVRAILAAEDRWEITKDNI